MIRNIIFSFLIFDLIVALSISLLWWGNGIEPHTIRLGSALLPVIKQMSLQANSTSFKFSHLDEVSYLGTLKLGNWLDTLVFIANFFLYLYNSLLGVINFMIEAVNAAIELINFTIIMFNSLDSLVQAFGNA